MKVLLFGASGTAGGAVLQACLNSSAVEEVRVIVRRPLGKTDAKLREVVHTNYLDYAPVKETFQGVDACLFCLGTSITRVSKEDYVAISHDYAIAAARMLKEQSPEATFHYISGKGTRAESRTFWARVKGHTEDELMELVDATAWRPAFIDAEPSPSLGKIQTALYSVLRPALRLLMPFQSLYVAGDDLGRVMVKASKENLQRRVIENAEIREVAERSEA